MPLRISFVRRSGLRLLPVFLLAPALLADTPAPKPAAQPPTTEMNADDLFTLGQSLFETYAPPEIKKDFAFPTREQWDEFAARLEKTRETGSMAELAAYEPEARVALVALRTLPDYADYADWLEERLDEIVVAKEAVAQPPVTPPPVQPTPVPPSPGPTPPVPPVQPTPPGPKPPAPPQPPVQPASKSFNAMVPLYDLWVQRLRERPRPERADEFLPDLKTVFTSEGVTPALAWIPEVESTFNPRARSPSGARGLFQLMPITAKAQGLSLLPFDERVNPEKSARAAATLLRRLHGTFGSWPLALAAYNAGEGRVRRTLKAKNATTFAEIADDLSTETRLYVPKVLATLAVREGLDPAKLAAPSPMAK